MAKLFCTTCGCSINQTTGLCTNSACPNSIQSQNTQQDIE